MHFSKTVFMLTDSRVLQGTSDVVRTVSLSRNECLHGLFHLVSYLNSSSAR